MSLSDGDLRLDRIDPAVVLRGPRSVEIHPNKGMPFDMVVSIDVDRRGDLYIDTRFIPVS